MVASPPGRSGMGAASCLSASPPSAGLQGRKPSGLLREPSPRSHVHAGRAVCHHPGSVTEQGQQSCANMMPDGTCDVLGHGCHAASACFLRDHRPREEHDLLSVQSAGGMAFSHVALAGSPRAVGRLRWEASRGLSTPHLYKIAMRVHFKELNR